MNHLLTSTWFIIITVQLLNLSTTFGRDPNAQLSLSDDQIPNYSHQNETDDSEPNHILNIKSSRINAQENDDGWSDWSEWSTCSRSCDGGVSIALRKCNHKKGCTNGNPEKYKICNMQPCPTVIDFRATQCSTYNNKPYRGRLYQWLPYKNPLDPCSLTCKAQTFNFVAQLATRVEDGTRCRDGSLDMCVAGKCLSVGCDLQLGSENKVDECGICGGDGSSCKRPTYIWSEDNYSPCSVSCGRGYQMSHPICVDKEAKEQVDEILCDQSLRPRPHIIECNTQKCPPFWIIEVWTPCNRKCGGGKQTRIVYCVQDVVNGTRVKVSDNSCPKQKPTTERSCNIQECPQWFEGPWSECSTTCDSGYQTRAVVCRDVRGFYSNECTNETKPNDKQNCSVGIQCLKHSLTPNENSQEDSPRVLPFHLPWVQKFTSPSISTEPNFIVGEWSSCSTTCGKGIRKRSVECKIFLEFSRTIARLPDSQCPGIKPNYIEDCFLSECSAPVIQDEGPDDDDSYGEDDKENEIITSGVEKPINKMIPLSKIGIEVNYYWKSAGFTECTASCLGGTQESIIHCVKAKDETVVNSYLCDINKKLDSFTRTCNDNPCPPRWNVTEFGVCSKECGGGVHTREVQCVHEVTRGTANTIVVPNHQCHEPIPRSKQFCNVFDCTPLWKTEPWTKCSRSCGGGVKTRKLKCIKELAFGQLIEQPPSKCPKKRPKVIKMCNSKQCRNPMLELRKVIRQSPDRRNSDKIDENVFVQKEPEKRVSLKVSGEAIVIEGTIVRLRCPRRKADRESNHTEWFKNNVKVEIGRKIRYTGKSALRIKNILFSDSGVYTCSWNNRTFYSIDLQVRHLSRSDEDRTVERPNFVFTNSQTNDPNFGRIKTTEEDNDKSHNINKINKWNQRDPILMKSKPKRAYSGRKNGNKEPKILDEDSYSAESPQKSPNPSLDTWEVNYGTNNKPTEFTDQNDNTHDFYDYNRRENNDDSEEKFRGEKNREDSISQLQKLLANMRKSTKQPNNVETTSESFPTDSLINMSVSDVDMKIARDNKIEPSVNLMVSTFVLGKGNPKNLKFNWMTTDWSNCTLPCGGTGFQVRASQCYVSYENVSKTVDNSLCIDADLEIPETIRNCGIPECPLWETGQWSDCNECINLNTAIQQREVRCAFNNGTILEHHKCSAEDKPITKQQCSNDKCQGTWIVGDWSECNGKCGEEGFQSRIIQCVWFNTANPAGNACKDKPRPEVLQYCNNKSCNENNCIDKSKHCNLAKSLNMCRISHYRHQCCASCKSES